MAAEKKSIADLVQHTKVSPVFPHGYSQNPSSSIASSFVPTTKAQRADPWLQSLEKCRCLLLLSPACNTLGACVFMKPAAQRCVICLPSLPLYSALQVPIQESLLQYSDRELSELAAKNFKSKYLPKTQHWRGWSQGGLDMGHT